MYGKGRKEKEEGDKLRKGCGYVESEYCAHGAGEMGGFSKAIRIFDIQSYR